ncbi:MULTISPECIES: preprotein translocase subunit SecG [Xanthomonas]|uniref:Protein-export membrane protein SecG n=1 Tax=Xanthomonas melonis TaxID=56456 RepID=A0ABS8NR67_9XANT|nr:MULTISPECIES: preprotein translocase subunit SecG [Xanthomonas]MCC4587407.1 preprotein translocase subunit SecG [Xanthomonas sp. NCPPB 1067]MCD0247824.1 preprotein translocase subunit SecG [Xanthomonas melonis]MCD0257328.1 preprotein translocase subunit SecG [Xanthomonas melonis]MCD0265547.1 preprotein translocase subunit SecG [Xanthomonas melonis]MCD0280144.1 preprotein translocase subunit SecG [Xanthomonas melonis]
MLMLILNVVYVLVALAMIALILMQRGAGAAAGSGFGAGASGTVFGSQGSSNFLSKSTKWLAVVFFSISLFMAWYATHGARPTDQNLGVMSQSATPAPAAAGELTQPLPQAPAAGAVPTAPAQPAADAAPVTAPAQPAPTQQAPASNEENASEPAQKR